MIYDIRDMVKNFTANGYIENAAFYIYIYIYRFFLFLSETERAKKRAIKRNNLSRRARYIFIWKMVREITKPRQETASIYIYIVYSPFILIFNLLRNDDLFIFFSSAKVTNKCCEFPVLLFFLYSCSPNLCDNIIM